VKLAHHNLLRKILINNPLHPNNFLKIRNISNHRVYQERYYISIDEISMYIIKAKLLTILYLQATDVAGYNSLSHITVENTEEQKSAIIILSSS